MKPSRVDLQPGTEFAGYRIVSTLGRGGMAMVYLAEHDFLQRKVALKVLAPQLAEDERFRERFVRESRLAASLDHPNVVPIYEAGASGGDLFIAMRYVEGTDLRTMLAESGALDAARAISICRQVAAALDAAHEQGLVHRDVKPANVLVARTRGSEAGQHVYLSDFGLTKRSAGDPGLTRTGQFVGTLDYAGPEQFRGQTLDARADVYSLGCVLFECLTGHPPFASESDAGLMYAHLQAPPPAVTTERPELDSEIDGVIARAMAKAPEDRQSSAGTLVDEAAHAVRLGVSSESEWSWGPRSRHRVLAVALALAVTLLAGIWMSWLLPKDTEEPTGADRQTSTQPSPSPTIGPTFRTVERPIKSGDEQRLLAAIPANINSDCLPLDRPEPIQGELAALVCRMAHVEVLYELFPTRAAMDAAFEEGANRTRAPVGECASDRVAVTSYAVGGTPTGRVLCYTMNILTVNTPAGPFPLLGNSHIEWTDENALIYAHAVRNDLGDLSLYEWWLSSAGPVVSSVDDATPPRKDRPAALPTLLRDGTYLLSFMAQQGSRRIEETDAIELAHGTYQYVIDGEIVEEGMTYLLKPSRIVFTPSLFAGPRCHVRILTPVWYAYSVRGDSVTWDKLRGGYCAGPNPRYVPSRPWTRASSG